MKEYKLKVEVYRPVNTQEMLKTLKKDLSTKGHYIIANFEMSALYPMSGGHISPLVSYEEKTEITLAVPSR